MKYKITIETIVEKEDGKYPTTTEIFTQVLSEEEMNKGRMLGIIKAVNDLPDYK